MLLSVITVMLYMNAQGINSGTPSSYDIKIGGLNETELFELKQIWPFPEDSEVEAYGAWSVNFMVERMTRYDASHWRMTSPPVNAVAPFLSCIKSWGYKITFYNSYAGDIQHPNTLVTETIPLMSHTWMLENHSEPITTSIQFSASSTKVVHIISESITSRRPTSPTQNTDMTTVQSDSTSSSRKLIFSTSGFLFWTVLIICIVLVRHNL